MTPKRKDIADSDRAAIMADNVTASDELCRLAIEIRRTLNNPAVCWEHVERACQKVAVLNVNVALLAQGRR